MNYKSGHTSKDISSKDQILLAEKRKTTSNQPLIYSDSNQHGHKSYLPKMKSGRK